MIFIEHLTKDYGNSKGVFDLSFSIRQGEVFGYLGPNGAGKSTLIKIIMGLVQPDNGEVIRDSKINIGYYSQEFENFDLNKTLAETMREKCKIGEDRARPMLGRFLFMGDKVFQRVGLLSGGEKTRLAIATLLGQNFNLLILDEPTTYLDPLSQRVILEAVKEYKGAILVVSHTPEFIEELRVAKKLWLPENRIETNRI